MEPFLVPVVDVRDLQVRYGAFPAVNGLDLQVDAGEVVGLLGGNGAGKSSTLRAVAGVNPPSGGQLLVAGHDVSDRREVELVRRVVGYCPDVGGLLRQATVREHIAVALALRGCTHLWPDAMNLAADFDLLDVMDRATAGFSHGMSRRLSVLLATLTAEKVLVLDEPFDGVDPLGADATLDAVRRAKRAGLAVIVSTHLMDLIVASCDRVVVMSQGTLVDAGPAAEFAGEAGKIRYGNVLKAAR